MSVKNKKPAKTTVEVNLDSQENKPDPWGVSYDQQDYKKWKDMANQERIIFVVLTIVKIAVALGCLYLFVCSLSVMGSSFQILAGKTAGTIFQNSFLSNPVTGLIIGILVTVLVQSSSTSTSIVTTMVGADIISVHTAIPIVMGANIGTSVTNTIVALMQSMDASQFRRAFAGATVHDIFNLLSVLILLPLEVASGYLEHMTKALVDFILHDYNNQVNPPDILKVITKPLTKKIVQVDKSIIKKVAKGEELPSNTSMVKLHCSKEYINEAYTYTPTQASLINSSLTAENSTSLLNSSILMITPTADVAVESATRTIKINIKCNRYDDFVFADSGLSDGAIGAILLICSVFVLCVCLLAMVKILHSLLKGGVSKVIKKVINTNFPYPFGWVAGYLAILVGAGLTFIVQSSSVFTSTLTPLVGMGVISLKRMYPLTLGSNIGTTTTSILAALTADAAKLNDTLQISFCHFFFNVTGIIIWYPIPIMRRVPLRGAKFLGRTTAKYRWFAIFYLIMVFFISPAIVLGLSLAGIWVMGSILIVVGVIILIITVVSILQRKTPQSLPHLLRDWKFLPLPLRSLEPYDRVITLLFGCCRCCKKSNEEDDIEVHDNKTFQNDDTAV